MPQSISDTLNLAADLIEERGWVTGDSDVPWGDGSDNSPLCIEGGILAAVGWTPDLLDDSEGIVEFTTCPAYLAVHKYLNLRIGFRLYGWNDEWAEGGEESARTATEVVEVLRATALIESAREREAAQVTA